MKLEDTLRPESKRKSAAPKGQKKTSKNTESAFSCTVTGAPKNLNKRRLGQGQEYYFGVARQRPWNEFPSWSLEKPTISMLMT